MRRSVKALIAVVVMFTPFAPAIYIQNLPAEEFVKKESLISFTMKYDGDMVLQFATGSGEVSKSLTLLMFLALGGFGMHYLGTYWAPRFVESDEELTQ